MAAVAPFVGHRTAMRVSASFVDPRLASDQTQPSRLMIGPVSGPLKAHVLLGLVAGTSSLAAPTWLRTPRPERTSHLGREQDEQNVSYHTLRKTALSDLDDWQHCLLHRIATIKPCKSGLLSRALPIAARALSYPIIIPPLLHKGGQPLSTRQNKGYPSMASCQEDGGFPVGPGLAAPWS